MVWGLKMLFWDSEKEQQFEGRILHYWYIWVMTSGLMSDAAVFGRLYTILLYYLRMDLPFMFTWRFYLPSFCAHVIYQKNICKYLTDLVQRQLSFPVILPGLLDWQWHWNISKILQRHNEELFSSQLFSHVPQKMSFWRRTRWKRQSEKKKKRLFTQSDSCQAAERERAVWCN